MRGRLAGGLFVMSAAAVVLAGVRRPWARVELPVARPIVVMGDLSTEVLDTLRRGETLSELLARQGVLDLDLARLDAAKLDPRRLRAGLVFSFRRPAADSLPDRISVRATPEQRVVFRRAAQGWESAVDSIHWRAEPFRIEGAIDNSLYEAIDAQVVDEQLDAPQRQRLAWDLADIYAWQVDFTRDIQSGDRFQVVIGGGVQTTFNEIMNLPGMAGAIRVARARGPCKRALEDAEESLPLITERRVR